MEGQVDIMRHLRLVADNRHEAIRQKIRDLREEVARCVDAQAVEDRDRQVAQDFNKQSRIATAR